MYDRPYHKGTKDRENEFKVRRILSWDTDSIIFYTMGDQLFTLLQASTYQVIKGALAFIKCLIGTFPSRKWLPWYIRLEEKIYICYSPLEKFLRHQSVMNEEISDYVWWQRFDIREVNNWDGTFIDYIYNGV